MLDEGVKDDLGLRSESFSALDAFELLLVRVVEFVFQLFFDFSKEVDRVDFEGSHGRAGRSSGSRKSVM